MLMRNDESVIDTHNSASSGEDKLHVVVRSMTLLANETLAVEFTPLDGGSLPPFTAGAHIDLLLPNGIRRSYSLCNSQHEVDRYVVGVKRATPSRGASSYVHDQLRVGQTLCVSTPRNNFPLHEAARHSVLIAGGIGITPIWGMVQRLVALERSWELHYAVRTPADAAFLKPLLELDGRYPGRVNMTFDHEPGGKMLDVGAIVKQSSVEDTHFYACGPSPMLDAFERAAAAMPTRQAHLERFNAGDRLPAVTTSGFEVVLSRSGRTLSVSEGEKILDVLLDEGVQVAFSCMDGVCGSCKIKVLEGTPDHRDIVLSDEERARNDVMLVCCSGCKGDRLVLDI